MIGLPSAGVHANGFTLVRARARATRTTTDPTCWRRPALPRRRARAPRARAQAFAHVTGGGILGNLGASLPDGLRGRARLGRVGAAAGLRTGSPRHVEEDELRRVFNLGIGYCAVVAGARAGDDRDRTDRRRDRRPRQRQGHEPAGAARRRPARRRGRVEPTPRVRALERAERGRRPDATSSSSTSYRDPRGARRGDGRLARGRTASSSSSCAGYMHLLTTAFLDRFPERIVNVHPSLLPRSPARTRSTDALAAGVETTGVTVHFVDEGVDTGTDHPPGAGRRSSRARRSRSGSTRSSTGCCPQRPHALVRQLMRALISVYDKTGLAVFARGLADARLGARRERRHGGVPRGARASRSTRVESVTEFAGDARRPREDAAPADPRRHPRPPRPRERPRRARPSTGSSRSTSSA